MKNFFNRLMYGKSNKADYTKEAMQSESRTKLFFDILGVKYMQLIKLNLLLVVCMLPAILWTWMSFSASADLSFQERAYYQVVYSFGLIPCLLLLAAPLAGITYIIKNFTQDKHVWLWKDFVGHTKSNAKQAILYMLIYSIAGFIGQIILYAYTVLMPTSTMVVILRGIYIVIYAFIMISAMYAFPMMVTYELKLRHVIRNSLLLTVGSLNTTFFATLFALLPVIGLFVLSLFWPYGIFILGLYLILFGFAFGIYVIVSFTTVVFARHLQPSDDEHEDDKDNQQS